MLIVIVIIISKSDQRSPACTKNGAATWRTELNVSLRHT